MKNRDPYLNKKALVASLPIGIGTSLAMMPIFNHEVKELKNYQINPTEYDAWYIISTVNTLLITSAITTISNYRYFSTKKNNENLPVHQKIIFEGIKIGSALSATIPVCLLWNIELHNKEVEESQGFDQFLIWASVATIPLFFAKYIENCNYFHKLINNMDSLTLNNKCVDSATNIFAVTALLGRSITYTAVTYEVINKIAQEEEDIALPVSVIVGGFMTSLISSVNEFYTFKKILNIKKENITFKNIAAGIFSFVEGMWFAAPFVSAGLNHVKNWHEGFKSVVFAPYFASKTIQESVNIYEDLFGKEVRLETIEEMPDLTGNVWEDVSLD